MSQITKKKKIFGNIAAAKTLTETMPKLLNSSSLPSINNDSNVISFLTDLIKSLIGQKVLVSTVVEFLTKLLPRIETTIKKALKTQLKSIVSCGINPSIPPFLKSGGDGIVIEVKKIDFTDLLKIDPSTSIGSLLYLDSSAGLLSSDLNTFIHAVIQDDGVEHSWKGILNFKFVSLDASGVNPNNSLIIKATALYENKSFNDLNNDFVDSIKLFDTANLINNIIDIIFGSISVKQKKTTKQLEIEGKINSVVDKLVDLDEDEIISDDYFTFNNEELLKIQTDADNRKRGFIDLETSSKISATISEQQLTTLSEEMGTAVTKKEQKAVLTKNLESMAKSNTDNSRNKSDNSTIEANFIQSIISNLLKAIIGVLLTPKIVCLFLINFKVVNGPEAKFENGIDFIKQNNKLFKDIVKSITLELSKFLVAIVLKYISKLVLRVQIKKRIDKQKNKVVQILSLIGIPQEALRIIKGLS
jgi:hypothetical protein